MSVYLITGAAGYIGSMLTKYLLCSDDKAKVIALVRNSKKTEWTSNKNIEVLEADLTDRDFMSALSVKCDYLFHCASVTKSVEMITHPVEVVKSIVNATQNVLELARRCNVQSMVYLSSMEIYGEMDCSDGHKVTEEEQGKIDVLSARSCYPLGKRMAENICYSYFKEYGIPVKIARLAQTFGYGVLRTDNRVFMQFARAVKKGTDIVLHTKGSSMGNYCSIDDVISGMLTILRYGTDGEAYNIVNEKNTMTIRQMAELVSEKIAGGNISVVYDIPETDKFGYAVETGLCLSSSKLRELGWESRKGIVEMYQDVLKELEG